MLLLPMQRIVSGRWRESFFLGWTLLERGGARSCSGHWTRTEPSPLTLPLMMPMLFAGMSYPRRFGPDLLRGEWSSATAPRRSFCGREFAFSAFFFMVLLWTAGMCLWQAHNRERQHDELERQRDDLSASCESGARRPTDPLTDALNRRGFEDRLRRELADSARSERPLMLAVLRPRRLQGGQRSRGPRRRRRPPARDGRSASAGVLRPSGRRRAAAAATSSRCCFPARQGRRTKASSAGCATRSPAGVPASFGYTCFPADGIRPEELFKQADVRLYAAKSERPRQRATRRRSS